jgi:hypothetical protein
VLTFPLIAIPAKEAVAKGRIAAETYSFVIPAKAGI